MNPQDIFGSSSAVGAMLMVFLGIFVVVILVLIVTILIPMCLIFRKAGRSWWEAIIPFYNMYVWTIITGQPWWFLILMFVPFVNYIVIIYLYYHLSKRFGFDIPFTVGLVFLPFIFFPILAWGKAVYISPEVVDEAEEEEVTQPVAVVEQQPITPSAVIVEEPVTSPEIIVEKQPAIPPTVTGETESVIPPQIAR